jgi:DNA mismatch repair protein MutL
MVKLAQLEGSVGISGYVSLPSFTRANRTGIAIFVNRRYIEDRTLVHAVVQGYHTLLPVGRFPVAVVMVELDPSQVDVNVHPQKTQVRFIEERRIFNAVQKTVRQSVIEQAPVPNFVFTASALPGGWQSSAAPPSVEGVDVDFWQPSDQGGAAAYPGAEAVLAAWAERRTVLINAGQSSLDSASSNSASFDLENADRPLLASARQNSAFAEDVEQNHALEQTAVVSASVMPPLLRRTSQLPPLRVVGQIGAMYIVTEGPGGMFLIDQHAAHERILYEKFMTQRHGGLHAPTPVNAQQYLLEPLTLHLGTHLAGLVAQHLDALASVGFVIEVFGGDTFLVRGVPNVLSGEDPLHMLEEIVQALADRRDGRRNLLGETVEAQLVKMVCKRAAIKAGQLLSDLEMQELVRQLEECESPRTCPHGRPTMIQLSAGELEKAFGRI